MFSISISRLECSIKIELHNMQNTFMVVTRDIKFKKILFSNFTIKILK